MNDAQQLKIRELKKCLQSLKEDLESDIYAEIDALRDDLHEALDSFRDEHADSVRALVMERIVEELQIALSDVACALDSINQAGGRLDRILEN